MDLQNSKKPLEPLQIELRGLNDTCGNNLSSAASTMAAVFFIWLQQGVVTAGQFDQYETAGIHATACWTETYIILYTITLMEVNLSPKIEYQSRTRSSLTRLSRGGVSKGLMPSVTSQRENFNILGR